ncbi:hypothetical protein CRENBAI_010237 [Crenichthys baileyi]|uniref:Uncharacterized protein n=1 Tax=Crenichthys baileyi TaxID=28760 RepID=A0AAV9RK37_9TELE
MQEERRWTTLPSVSDLPPGLHPKSNEGPLQSIVSMGWRHPVPHGGLYRRDSSPPLDLLQWVYQMERDRKVGAGDISLPTKYKRYNCGICAHAAFLFSSVITAEALADKSLSLSNRI